MSQANDALIRKLFEIFRSGDREAASRLFAEDAVFSYDAPGPIHGEWRGREGIIAFWAAQDRHSGDGVRPEMVDLVAGERHVFLLVRFPRADGSGIWLRVVVYEVSEGMITGARVFEGDPAAAAAFFSRGA